MFSNKVTINIQNKKHASSVFESLKCNTLIMSEMCDLRSADWLHVKVLMRCRLLGCVYVRCESVCCVVNCVSG